MLKLERDDKTQQVRIYTTRSQSLFTQAFVTALIVATSLHLAFFLLFRVSTGQTNYPHLLLPPVTVQAVPNTMDSANNYALTEYELNSIAKRIAYEPRPSPITIPPIAQHQQSTLLPSTLSLADDEIFASLETEYLLTEQLNISFAFPSPRTHIHISGPLGERPLKMHDIPQLKETIILPLSHIEQHKYSYDVIVDNDSGKIIWFQPNDLYGHHHVNETEQLLLALNFEKSTKTSTTKGHIEITTTSERSDHD